MNNYFPHDFQARNDSKVLLLRAKYGAEGYGIFWMLVELMEEGKSPHLRLESIPALAVVLNTQEERLKEIIDYCINVCRLFVTDGESFTSFRVLNHKIFLYEFHKNGKKGAEKRWGKEYLLDNPPNSLPNTLPLDTLSPPYSPPNAKEIKRKEIKQVLKPFVDLENKSTLKTEVFKDFKDLTLKAWNDFCEKHNMLARVRALTESRIKHLRLRFEQPTFRDFGAILVAIEEQPFLINGNPDNQNHRHWRVSFDWLIDNDTNHVKVLERKYKDIQKKEESRTKHI